MLQVVNNRGHRHRRADPRRRRSRARPAPRRPRPASNPHAWFIAFAPADHPRYAIAVLVEHGGIDGSDAEATGGRVAAPIAAQVLRTLARDVTAMRPQRESERTATRRYDQATDRVSPRMSLVGRVFSNRYEIQREIAQGGMAEVYLARDQLLEPAGRAEGAVPRVRARAVVRRAVPPRGAGRREPQPPEHRRDLRLGPGVGHVLHRDGVRRGPLAARPHPQRRPARPGPGRRHRRRDRVGARVRAPQRRRAPRREARQRAAHAIGHREGHRLRHRARGHERRAHADRFGHGHRDVLLARAGARASRSTAAATCTRSASCSTRWCTASRRSPATRRSRVAYKHVREEPIPPSQRNPDVPARPRADHPDRARQGSRAPLPDRRRPARRPPALPARPSARGRAVTAIVAEVPTTAVADRGRRRVRRRATVASPRVAVEPPRLRPPPRTAAPRRHVHRAHVAGARRVVGGILFASRSKLGNNQKTVSVPDVVDKTDGAGARKSSRRTASHGGDQARREQPEAVNTVIEQNPKAGADVKKNSTVTLTVSARRRVRSRSPTSTNMTVERRARRRSTRSSFQVKVDPRAVEQRRRPRPRHQHRTRRRTRPQKVGTVRST